MSLTRPITRSLTRAITRALTAPGAGGGANNEATIVILLGQSLNVPRGSTLLAAPWPEAQMLEAGGAASSAFTFWATNPLHCTNWTDVASSVSYTEGAAQGVGAGILNTLKDGPRPTAYSMSVAIGARPLTILEQGAPRAQLAASIYRLCDIARADGYTPKVVFYSAHGETDAFDGTTEANYYSRGKEYYQMAQMYAAMAMEDPSYVAPVYLTYPAQQSTTLANLGENDRNIKEAIRRIAQDLDGGVDMGSIYQWPIESDRVHPEENAYIFRGERLGRILAGNPEPAPYITGVTLSGATFVATFSEPVVRDASLGVGSALNAANALDGFEWLDNGAFIQITGLVYSGATVTGTLASTPSGSLAQQQLRIACQYTGSSLAVWPANDAGSYVRADTAGWESPYDPTYTNYRWAIPQRITEVEAA